MRDDEKIEYVAERYRLLEDAIEVGGFGELPAPETPVEPAVRKIAVLGTTPSRMEAPVADESWAIWTIGPGGKDLHRWDRLYETHTIWPEDFKAYLNDLSKVQPPQEVRSIVPMKLRMQHWATRWGKDEKWLAETITGEWLANSIIDRDHWFEQYGKLWFSTSICYAIVDVLEDHAARRSVPHTTVLGLFGIDLESDEEHISQFIGCKHFLDIARLVGIDIVMPKGCGLERDLNPYPDRYETHLALTYEKKLALLNNLIGQCEADLEGRKMMIHRIEGALLKLGELKSSGLEVDQAVIKGGEEELARNNGEFSQVLARLHQLRGEKSATEYYQRMFTWGMFDPARQL